MGCRLSGPWMGDVPGLSARELSYIRKREALRILASYEQPITVQIEGRRGRGLQYHRTSDTSTQTERQLDLLHPVTSDRACYSHMTLPGNHGDGGRYDYLPNAPRDLEDVRRVARHDPELSSRVAQGQNCLIGCCNTNMDEPSSFQSQTEDEDYMLDKTVGYLPLHHELDSGLGWTDGSFHQGELSGMETEEGLDECHAHQGGRGGRGRGGSPSSESFISSELSDSGFYSVSTAEFLRFQRLLEKRMRVYNSRLHHQGELQNLCMDGTKAHRELEAIPEALAMQQENEVTEVDVNPQRMVRVSSVQLRKSERPSLKRHSSSSGAIFSTCSSPTSQRRELLQRNAGMLRRSRTLHHRPVHVEQRRRASHPALPNYSSVTLNRYSRSFQQELMAEAVTDALYNANYPTCDANHHPRHANYPPHHASHIIHPAHHAIYPSHHANYPVHSMHHANHLTHPIHHANLPTHDASHHNNHASLPTHDANHHIHPTHHASLPTHNANHHANLPMHDANHHIHPTHHASLPTHNANHHTHPTHQTILPTQDANHHIHPTHHASLPTHNANHHTHPTHQANLPTQDPNHHIHPTHHANHPTHSLCHANYPPHTNHATLPPQHSLSSHATFPSRAVHHANATLPAQHPHQTRHSRPMHAMSHPSLSSSTDDHHFAPPQESYHHDNRGRSFTTQLSAGEEFDKERKCERERERLREKRFHTLAHTPSQSQDGNDTWPKPTNRHGPYSTLEGHKTTTTSSEHKPPPGAVNPRAVRNQLLRERAIRLADERSGGMSTDDETNMEICRAGRYWSRSERREHVLQKQRQKREALGGGASSNTSIGGMVAGEGGGYSTLMELSQRKLSRLRNRKLLDDWTTVEELLTHGTRLGAQDETIPIPNSLLTVTTV